MRKKKGHLNLNSSNELILLTLLLPVIPPWIPKRKYFQPTPTEKTLQPVFTELPRSETGKTKECAICRRSNADYEHTCGVSFHKTCIRQYFDALSIVDGAERICPHCYAPFPLDFDAVGEKTVEVSLISDEVYNQYLEISDKFSLALIEGRIMDISVFLTSPSNEQYFVNVDFGYYPRKPTFSFPDELLANIEGLGIILEQLNNWDPENPPKIVDVLLNIQSWIIPNEKKIMEEKSEREKADIEEEGTDKTILGKEQKNEYVEVVPEEEIVEVTLEDMETKENEKYEVKEILPATFFEIDASYEPQFFELESPQEEFENEEAIKQYLNLSNNYSVELVGDDIYHVVSYLSCLDGDIYNIYPITIKLRDYPNKPSFTFTDELLVRIRGLDEILGTVKNWDFENPLNVVDVISEFERRLMEDSILESEIEVIKREYKTERLSKNRILVGLITYGYQGFDIELDLRRYPEPPELFLPEELKKLDTNELEAIKRWPEKPQKRILDVLHSLNQAINRLYRLEFEKLLLEMVSDELKLSDEEYHVVISIPNKEEEITDQGIPAYAQILLKFKIPNAYPLAHPTVIVDSDDEETKTAAQNFLNVMLKSWAPNMFLADAVNRLSLSLTNTSLFKCLICGQKECPICGQSLLTIPVEENEDICEMPCIQCKRPYHLHCLKNFMNQGLTKCGYCLTDLGRFFKEGYFSIVG